MKKVTPILIIVAGLLIAGAIVYVNFTKCQEETGDVLPSDEVSQSVIDYINNNILRGQAIASLIDVSEETGLYKIKFSVEGQEIESYATRNGKLFFPEGIDLTNVEPIDPAAAPEGVEDTIGGFSATNNEICKENEKPVIYFFGSESCPYCNWEHPVIEEVAGKFGNRISFHNNMNSNDDKDIFQKYSTGGIPTLIFGCKYYRVGAGTNYGEEEEAKNLTALICKLTNNEPGDVCNPVQDLINQI